MNKTNIPGLHFQPWIGENYYKMGKVLLLGESHYLDEEPSEEDNFSKGYSNLTIEVVKENFLAKKDLKTTFFRNTGFLFYSDDCYRVWNDISFANLIQIGLANSTSQPSEQEKKTVPIAFKLLLDNLKPEKVLVLSKRMWNDWLPEDNGNFVKDIDVNGKNSTIWQFRYVDGKCLEIGINHPSRMLGNSCHFMEAFS